MKALFALVRWIVMRFVALFFFALRLVVAPFRRNRQLWLELELQGSLLDVPKRPTLLSWFQSSENPSLFELLKTLEKIKSDKRVHGVVVKIRDVSADWNALWELRQALEQVRGEGKKLIFYGDAVDLAGLWLGSAGDDLYVSPQGGVELTGFRAEIMFFKAILDKLGVKADFLRVGRYKSYPETFTRESMSEDMAEAMNALLGDLRQTVIEDIARGNSVEFDDVQQWINQGPYRAEVALEHGLISGISYEDDLWKVQEEAGEKDGKNAVLAPLEAYRSYLARQASIKRPLFGRQQVVVVEMSGPIVEKAEASSTRGGPAISRKSYVDLFRMLKEDPDVAAVLLRVNSPGGSALVSDLLWHEIKVLKEEKPLFVSMGAAAASGGYYVSAPAERIFAAPVTMTGSIGVVAGKFSGGNLASRLGVTVDAIEYGDRAGIYSALRLFSNDEREHMQGQLDAMYGAFVSRVQEGRKLSDEAAEEAAQGRVWSGLAAKANGLVDEMGGMQPAWTALLKKLELPENKVEVVAVSSPGAPGLSSLVGMSTESATWRVLETLSLGHLKPLAELAKPGTRFLAFAPYWWRLR